MESKEIISDEEIIKAIGRVFYDGKERTADEGRLMLLELLSKAGAGYYNSHTEEIYLSCFGLTRRTRMPNKKGMKFICSMTYKHSNLYPDCFDLIKKHRTKPA